MDPFSETRWPEIRAFAISQGVTPAQAQKWRERRKVSAMGLWKLFLAAKETKGFTMKEEEARLLLGE